MNDKLHGPETPPGSSTAVDTTRKRHLAAPDPRSTAELVEPYIAHCRHSAADDSRTDDSLGILHCRGGQEEFNAATTLLASSDSTERAAGADILAQLGWGDQTFLEESVNALLRTLHDPADEVVRAAIYALGHRRCQRAIAAVLPFADHPSVDLRFAAVFGLMSLDTPVVVEALIRLSQDVDKDVRDWATFALGSQLTSDSPALRAALHERISDMDPETRGEALVGLARRSDTSIAAAILSELEGEFHGNWAVEAAELLGDPLFLPALKSLLERLDPVDCAYFYNSVQQAISACTIADK